MGRREPLRSYLKGKSTGLGDRLWGERENELTKRVPQFLASSAVWLEVPFTRREMFEEHMGGGRR